MKAQSGFSMIEVLVTIAILVFGLLGLGALQTVTTMAELEAYQRSQALVLVQDMSDRIAGNKANALSYVANDVGLSAVDCSTKTTIADRDLCEWGNELFGAAEVTSGGTNTGAMIGARGCVTQASPNVYKITIAWQGFTGSLATKQLWEPCGQDAYGQGKRRTVSTLIRVPLLGA